jgi:hypothetical protein
VYYHRIKGAPTIGTAGVVDLPIKAFHMLQTTRTPTTIEAPTMTTIPNFAIPDAMTDKNDPYVLLALSVKDF